MKTKDYIIWGDIDSFPLSESSCDPNNHLKQMKTAKKDKKSSKPVVCIGWPTIALLAHGKTVELKDVILTPESSILNIATKIASGYFNPITKQFKEE